MRASTVLLAGLGCTGLLVFSSCATSSRYAGGQWEPATDTPKRGRALAGEAAPAVVLPLRPDVLNIGEGGLRYPPPRPLARGTVEVKDAPPLFTPATPTSHVVAPGETLFAIARNELGDASRWRDILEVNPGLQPSELKAGQRLKLPD